MTPEDQPGTEALRGGCPDVVGAKDVEDGGARHAHRRRGEREPERDRGKEEEREVRERIAGEFHIAAGVGEPPQVEREHHDDQRPQPEARERQADEAAQAHQDVQPRPRSDRREQPERDTDPDRDERRRRRQLERRGQALADLDEDRTSRTDRVPRVAMEERGEPAPVLDRQRLVQPEVRAQARELFRRERGGGPESRRDRVAGNEPNEEECEHRDAEERGDAAEEALREVAAHGSAIGRGRRVPPRPAVICPARSVVDR